MSEQLGIWAEKFETAQPANPLYCHESLLEKLAEYRTQPIGKRASLLLQRLAIDNSRVHFKSTRGANKGWRRSRLGGSQGSHFYLWWAPKGAGPLREGIGFDETPQDSIILRDIRHHDDHSPLLPQSLREHYLPVSIPDLRKEEYGPAPWTPAQSKFAGARHQVRILKGHPGSGKTTALLHAADAVSATRILYLTYSRDLAILARQHFDRYCSKDKEFHVVTFQTFLREFVERDPGPTDLASSRSRFRADMQSHARSLGIWGDMMPALYDELHAHMIGGALPVEVGRFAACEGPRSTDRNYKQRRMHHLGQQACLQVLEAMARIDKGSETVASRYFPDLALAWEAAITLKYDGRLPHVYLDFDCIAVDEAQDLTALDSFVVAEYAATMTRTFRRQIPVLFAGDEAQTVRPTDFEWGWLNDILHHRLATPSEFKLQANLRSPRRLATLVNRVWDLYGELEKKDRPSGTGNAEIEDDATDQLLYCTATSGPELNELLAALVKREGLALIVLDETAITSIPEAFQGSVLTASEAKGLDFHSVCVIDAGRHLSKILEYRVFRKSAFEVEELRKRLAIDQFRVALSRPTERLIWLDINPDSGIVTHSLHFLNSHDEVSTVAPAIPAAILQTLGEEELDVEERIQRCRVDARQFIEVRPEIAWSRAQMAVTLLGEPGMPGAVTDESLRSEVYLTLAEVCFCLGFRKVKLPAHLGYPDLYREARIAAGHAQRPEVSLLVRAIEVVLSPNFDDKVNALAQFVRASVDHRDQIPAWLRTEVRPMVRTWADLLENAVMAGDHTDMLVPLLPAFYTVMNLPDAEERTNRLHGRILQMLMKSKRYESALRILEQLPQRDTLMEAKCLEELGEYQKSAERYLSVGDKKSALHAYRLQADFVEASRLIREMKDHPAAESYEWLIEMQELIAKRPEKFTKVMLPSEKKMLETMMETALGSTRKKPAAKKAAVKKAVKKKVAAKKVVTAKTVFAKKKKKEPFF